MTVINDLHIDPLIHPTVETLRERTGLKITINCCAKSEENQVCLNRLSALPCQQSWAHPTGSRL